ncbi:MULTISPECIES: hypothetical protein [unclassified Mesorhizobium]|uniref:hypothetical protein n=1 Tax=unclassified Mesorhizobium TaxID=325217 RepID=UPI001926FD1A|nr:MULTISPECIES: hypothetical protein [unclassified Mesorhizobium]BCG82847.1 hypothetical protein MesoLj113b_63890 [Mesorhizobium sp. 113-3-3]BCG90724.1 hypothetical protein MesoLj113c_68340 [Mesorhizobium sp. 113-3-9]
MGTIRMRPLAGADRQDAAFKIDIGHLGSHGFLKPQAGAMEHKNKPTQHRGHMKCP